MRRHRVAGSQLAHWFARPVEVVEPASDGHVRVWDIGEGYETTLLTSALRDPAPVARELLGRPTRSSLPIGFMTAAAWLDDTRTKRTLCGPVEEAGSYSHSVSPMRALSGGRTRRPSP